MKNSPTFALTFFVVSLSAVAQSQEPSAVEEAVPAEIAVSAQRVYLDPQTGRLTDKPPSGAEVLTLSPEELNMLSTSHEGLVSTELPNGGYKVDLRGRFRHMAVATVNPDGSIAIRDVAGEAFLPAASEISEVEENESE